MLLLLVVNNGFINNNKIINVKYVSKRYKMEAMKIAKSRCSELQVEITEEFEFQGETHFNGIVLVNNHVWNVGDKIKKWKLSSFDVKIT